MKGRATGGNLTPYSDRKNYARGPKRQTFTVLEWEEVEKRMGEKGVYSTRDKFNWSAESEPVDKKCLQGRERGTLRFIDIRE